MSSNRILFCLIVLLATALRVYQLGDYGLWYDEAASVYETRFLSAPGKFFFSSPPFYHLFLYLWMQVSKGEVWLRALSVLFGLGIIMAVYHLCCITFDKKTALIASYLCSISPMLIFYAREVRMYSLFAFLVCLSWILWSRVIKLEGWQYAIGLTLIDVAIIYTHYFGFFVIAAQGFAIMLLVAVDATSDNRLFIDTRRLITSGLTALGLILLLYLPWLGHSLSSASRVTQRANSWIPKITIKRLFYFSKNLLAGYNAPRLCYWLIFIIFVMLIIYGCIRMFRTDRRGLYLLCWGLLPLALTIIVSIIFANSILLERFHIFILPAFFIIATVGLTRLGRREIIIILSVITILQSTSIHNLYCNRFPKEQARHHPGVHARKRTARAARLVKDALNRSDVIIHTCNSTYLPFIYYFEDRFGIEDIEQFTGDLNGVYLAEFTGRFPGIDEKEVGIARFYPRDIRAFASDALRVWLIHSGWEIADGQFHWEQGKILRDYLDATMHQLYSQSVEGIDIYLFEPNRHH